jgi:hypothetical protein
MSHAGTGLAVLACALLAPALASAQSSDPKGVTMRALGERNPAPAAKPGASAGSMKPCREYGAGFYRLAGSDTCVRIGGAVGADVGTSNLRR